MAKNKNKPIRIIAYGLDRKGFQPPKAAVTLGDKVTIDFVSFGSPAGLDDAHGVIIPQGAFEHIQCGGEIAGYLVCDGHRIDDELGIRERQALNVLGSGGWCCFLVGGIVDQVLDDSLEPLDLRDTDLCKRLLNRVDVSRQPIPEAASVSTADSRFSRFIESWGVARTQFFLPQGARKCCRTLATVRNAVVGFEHSAALFWLPFRQRGKSAEEAQELCLSITKAILGYRTDWVAQIPPWADDIMFHREQELGAMIARQKEDLVALRSELDGWKQHKAVLTASGERLRQEVLRVMGHFFALKLDPMDERREDFKILDDCNSILAFVECKGVNRSVRFEDVNQVDTNRERSGSDDSTPGILVINSDRSTEGIDERLAAVVDTKQTKHARVLNVLIIRTIDLLFLMMHLEEKPPAERGDVLLGLLRRGGGWLRCDRDGHELVQE